MIAERSGLEFAVFTIGCLQIISVAAKVPTIRSVHIFVRSVTGLSPLLGWGVTSVGVLLELATGCVLLVNDNAGILLVAALLWVVFLLLQSRRPQSNTDDAHCFCHGWLLGHFSRSETIGLDAVMALILVAAAVSLPPEHPGLGRSLLMGTPSAMMVLIILSGPAVITPWRTRVGL